MGNYAARLPPPSHLFSHPPWANPCTGLYTRRFYIYQSLKAAHRTHQLKLQQKDGGGGGGTGGSTGDSTGGGGGGTKLPVHLMLLFGGASGLAAQTVTYPLDVIRRRMQVSGIRKAVCYRLRYPCSHQLLQQFRRCKVWRGRRCSRPLPR